uniref:UDENN domain-containing protein n=1 Tax=Trichuris muris TaxID=70415 RepID=A0A5S6QN44_TRIMR
MASRLRTDTGAIFDVFAEVASDGSTSWVLWKYPNSFSDEKILRSIAEFAFPCPMTSDAVQLFSFVLTDLSGAYTFGFCRHTPRSSTCFCFLSAFPWPELFFKLLNHVATVADQNPPNVVEQLLANTYHCRIPLPNQPLILFSTPGNDRFECSCPDVSELPRIPENRYLTEYYNAVSENSMIAVFASMLCERRIIFTGGKVGKLSACVMAANLLIYPMHWQHIFIPVLPAHLCHYLNAPMPYMIGVPSVFYKQKSVISEIDLSDVVVLDIDTNTCKSPFGDVASLPREVLAVIKKNLRPNNMIGDGIARSFLRGLVVLIGGYREALQFRAGESITFNSDAFLQSRPVHMRPFLAKMLQLQIFRQFIDDRLDRLNKGAGLKDHFEEECNIYSGKDSNKFGHQYSEWMSNMKKEGGALVRQIRNKVRSKSKEAITDIRNIIADFKDESSSKPGDQSEPVRELHNPPLCVREKLRQRRSLHLKPARCPKWSQLNISRDDPSLGETMESGSGQDMSSVRKEQESESKMEEYLARRTSLLSRLEEQINNKVTVLEDAGDEFIPSLGRSTPTVSMQHAASDLIDLNGDTSKEVANSSTTDTNDASSEMQTNFEILKCIFSPPLASGIPQTKSDDNVHCGNWETFD